MGENPPRLNWGSLLDIQTFCGYRMSSEDIQLQRQTERTYCFPEFDKVVNKVMERGVWDAPSPHSAQSIHRTTIWNLSPPSKAGLVHWCQHQLYYCLIVFYLKES